MQIKFAGFSKGRFCPEFGGNNRGLPADGFRIGCIGIIIEWMFYQIFTYRQFGYQWNCPFCQLLLRAYSGSQQYLSAAIGAGRKDHFTGFELPPVRKLNSVGSIAIEKDLVNDSITHDRQIPT